jgi:hypothetical protein
MVLEAWQGAEKVWFPVVWEETKDASNVIDYNINKEITIDQSSVPNWNNDTTTGMANVIPWINAPKLISDTSIYKPIIIDKWPDVTVNGSTNSASSKFQFNNLTYTVTWDIDYGNNTWYIRIPISWVYRIHVKWRDQRYNTYSDWSIAYYFIESVDLNVTETVELWKAFEYDNDVYFESWNQLKFYVQNTNWGSMNFWIEITMAKL